jgi:hypothetical protein
MMIEGTGSITLMDPDPGGLKTCGSGFRSGSATLVSALEKMDKQLSKSLIVLDNLYLFLFQIFFYLEPHYVESHL